MTTADELLERLQENGHRITDRRRRLLASMTARGGGFTAEELVAEAPWVGRATVYRTIRLLVEEGLLCKLALEDGAPRYALSRVEHHHHVLCVQCGSVREFRQSEIEQVLRTLAAAEGESVVGHRLEVFVVCAACQRGD